MELWQILLLIISIIIIIMIVIVLVTYLAAYKLTSYFVSPVFRTREEKIISNKANPILSEYYNNNRVEFTYTLSDDYLIHGDYCINNDKKWVICIHGHSSTREGVVKQANIFYKLGFSVMLYDQRYHGDNEHSGHPTMGYQESIDAFEMVEFLRKKFGDDIKIGLCGASMGSATASLLLGKRQDFLFYVSDSGYYSTETVFKTQIKNKHLSWLPVLYIADKIIFKTFNLHFKDIVPGQSLTKSCVPILILHGSADTLIPVQNAEMLFLSACGPKEIHIFEGATHTRIFENDYLTYTKIVQDFVKKYDK